MSRHPQFRDGPTTGHVVYFILQRCDGGAFVKVGYSSNVMKRLASMQTASAVDLNLAMTFGYDSEAKARSQERYWRDRLAEQGGVASGEWIRLDDEIIGHFVTDLAGYCPTEQRAKARGWATNEEILEMALRGRWGLRVRFESRAAA